MLRVMPVFGTRPEAIKMAPLVAALLADEHIDCMVCVTGQHREMLDQVLDQFDIKPRFDLNIMKESQTLTSITSSVLEGMDEVIVKSKPDLILVHGDTTTSFAAALAAFYRKIPVGHVEAGLRSFDKYSPYPEELNRTLTAKIADLNFAPTSANRKNLLRESVPGQIFVTGNTVIDALQQMVKKDFIFSHSLLNGLSSSEKRMILLTAHRRENLGMPMESICRAVKRIAADNSDVEIIYPVHRNPAVRQHVWPILSDVPNVHLIDPIEVQDMHNLINRCYLVMTDSGGLQEEAPALGKPVLVLRKETERPEICEAGKALLVGTDENCIYEKAMKLLNDTDFYMGMRQALNPYGDGRASERIVKAIRYWAGLSAEPPIEFIV